MHFQLVFLRDISIYLLVIVPLENLQDVSALQVVVIAWVALSEVILGDWVLVILPWAPNTVGWHCNSQQQSQRQKRHVSSFTYSQHVKQQNGPRNCKAHHQQVFNVIFKSGYFTKRWAVRWLIFRFQRSRPKVHSSLWAAAVEKHDWYSTTTTPLWSCYGFYPSLKSPSLLRAISPPPHPAPPGLLWFNVFQSAAERVSQPIFNQGTWAQDSLIESVQESTLNPCSSEGRVNWEWTHWKKAAEKWQN